MENTDGPENTQDESNRNWQSVVEHFDDKLKHVMKSNLLCDLTVRLTNGDGTTVFKVHRLLFAMASEVFEKMILSTFQEGLKREIEIKNVKLEIFELLLAYIYNQPVKFTHVDQAGELLRIADYYLMKGLVKICLSYFETVEDPGLVCSCIEWAEKYNLTDLKDSKLEIIKNRTREVLEDESFLRANEHTVATILDQDSFSISERDLFRHVEAWIKHNLDSKGNEILGLLIPKFRFFSMTPKEFVDGPIKSKFLNYEQLSALSAHLLSKDCDLPLPDGMLKAKRKLRMTFDSNQCTQLVNRSEYFIRIVHSTNAFNISEVKIFTLEGNKEQQYEEEIEIKFGGNKSDYRSWRSNSKYKGNVHFSSTVSIKLDSPYNQATTCVYLKTKSGIRKTLNLSGTSKSFGDFTISFNQYTSTESGGCYQNQRSAEVPFSSIIFDP